MAEMQGYREFIKAMEKLGDGFSKEYSVVVGYRAAYAVYVHEDMEARHADGKQAKYLSEPADRMQAELAAIVVEEYGRTKNLGKALLKAGRKLQRESQKIVPVDTANLKNSAFTELEQQ